MKGVDYSRRYYASRPLAFQANYLLWTEIRQGRKPHPRDAGPCVDCGKPAQCYDHRDYTKPLDVDPVCLSCNRLRGPAHPYIDTPSVTDDSPNKIRRAHVVRAFVDRTSASISIRSNP